MANGKYETIATRQSLLQRLKDWDDQTSWRDFFDTYWSLIYGVARRAGLPDSEAQDVVQETMFAVAKKMGGFEYDPTVGSFKNWLMQLTRWRITDHWRKKQFEHKGQRQPREEPLRTSLMERQPAPPEFDLAQAWEAEWERNLFDKAMEKVRRQVKPIQLQMFQLHVVKNLDARKVMDRLGVKLSEVYYAKYKISKLIKKEIEVLRDKMD